MSVKSDSKEMPSLVSWKRTHNTIPNDLECGFLNSSVAHIIFHHYFPLFCWTQNEIIYHNQSNYGSGFQ